MSYRLAVTMAGILFGANAWAGSVLEDTLSSCTTDNCGAMSIRGVNQASEPFVIQVYAGANECLRLDIDSQTQDLVMLAATPSVNYGAIVDDRDFDAGDFRPLIVMDPTPLAGWYTVVVSNWDLVPTIGKFVLKYGRYPTGNPNCAVPAAATATTFGRASINSAKPRGQSN